jgi:hypothetical protein
MDSWLIWVLEKKEKAAAALREANRPRLYIEADHEYTHDTEITYHAPQPDNSTDSFDVP